MRSSVGIGVLVFSSTVVLSGIMAASGCTVLTNDGPPDDAGKFEGGDATSQTCATCLGQECTGQWATCLTDPACLAVAKRAASAACVAPDAGEIDGGVDPLALYGAFASCSAAKAAASCASDCSGTAQPSPCASDDGGIADAGSTDASDAGDAGDDAASDAGDDAGDASADAEAGTPSPVTPSVDACTGCVTGKCGDAKKTCAIGSECAAYLECTFAAADAAAADECGRQHATGKTAAVELATCTRVGCTDACGF